MLKLSYVFDDLLLRPIGWGGGAAKKYRIYGIPMTLLIKNGEVVEKKPGQRSEKFLIKKIAEYLEKEWPRLPARVGSC